MHKNGDALAVHYKGKPRYNASYTMRDLIDVKMEDNSGCNQVRASDDNDGKLNVKCQ